MTTIAWDGRTLAADRQVTYGGTRIAGRKIFDCGEYHYAASGSAAEAETVAEWLRAGAPMNQRPSLEDASRCGIVIRKADGAAFVVQGKPTALVEHRDTKLTCGSGCDFAQAAMEMGKTAAQAIVFASKFCIYTGMGVDSVTLKPQRRRK